MDYTVSDTHFLSTASGLLPPDTIALLSSRTTNTQLYLSTLSRLALRPDLTTRVFSSYEPLFPDLCARWRDTTTTASEIACAFARVLPLAPYLADVAEEFLTPGSIVLEDGLEVLLALWRLLVFRRESFSGLVKIESVAPLLTHKECAVRYLAVRVMCIFLKASDSTREEMFAQYGVGNEGEEKVIGAWEGKEIDYGFLVLMENKRLENLAKDVQTAKLHTLSPTLERRIIPTDALSPLIADLCGILTPRLRGPPSTPSKIIDTPTTRHNIHATAVSLRSSSPTLITGPAGSGKTFTVHQIAHTLNTLNTLISIHLGDQTDAKLLVGAYTTADTPGSFEWRPGVLTAAVKEGRWVLVEDIDKAPTEVLSVLLPLMERGELVIPSRGETIVAARGFRLIATMRTASTTNSAKQDSLHILGSRLWNRVDYKQPDETELHTIITARFPVLTAVAPSLLRVYNTIQHLYREPSFFALSKTSLGRQITPRDLIKWATRIDALFTSAGSNGEVIPEGLYDEIFMEAVDCFAGSLQTLDARHLVIRKIADEMLIPPQRVDLFLNGHIPAYNASDKTLAIGRAKLKKRKRSKRAQAQKRPFATTNHALRLLEQVGVAVRGGEPVLLVGETGTGKTTVVQQMADLLGYGLTVMNLSQQTESGDLLGGYKPVDVRTLAVPLKEVFEELFEKTFSLKRNKRFLEVLAKCWGKQQWNRVITLWGETVKMADQFFAAPTPEPQDGEGQPKKKRKIDSMDKPALQAQWTQFASDVATLERQSSQISKSFAFSFVEGSLVKAARNGDWVLLDEINLAAPDTLESIADLLKDGKDGDARSILLSEKGDVERVRAHPDFRIFACMNPATDVGKRDLPSGLRSRFTELYVVSPDQDLGNLLAIVREYLGPLVAGDERAVADVAGLYMEAKKLSEGQRLVDGANQRPHFSMRTLTRTLSYVVEIAGVYGLRRSLYEGFCMSFLTLLDRTSEAVLLPVIEKSILGNQRNVRSLVSQIPRRPVGANGEEYVQFKHYWMARGTQEVEEQPHYIITPFVERNMLNLVRATATRRFPVLIQGPTSSGKTSMIEYLAKRTGHKFVRINNHEHTDLQEYLGSYVSDNTGTLRFQEGILVEALRKGYWIVLDELNLAPTDVLEALNRLLDDNRELMIPETQEVVRPHKEFMLFATQNPPGLYGGRKVLSRAFRNRFLELHFDDIPEEELETILRERCGIAPSYCAKIVKVYKELSVLRQSTRLFEQKNSFATLRDLFRWANREAIGYQQLADNGYMLLAERVRKEDEKLAVKKVLEEVMRVKIDEAALYSPESTPEYQLVMKLKSDVVWTKAMRRLYSLVAHSLRNNEPVLLVGETGCGKTTVVQLLAEAFGKQLNIVNAHQNTETGDIIGAQRPIRNRTAYTAQLVEDLLAVVRDHSTIEQYNADVDLSILLETYLTLDKQTLNSIPEDLRSRIELNRIRVKALFEWSDGSLIQAMKEGQFFLLDEISLADDSVLERLNSVLEPQRGILLAEKGPEGSAVTAADGFQFLATMNPGGDYGKKELSPALRNRFTEIWVPSMSDYDDVLQIVSAKLSPFALQHAETIVKFAQWFSESYHFASSTISIRDVLAWVRFINMCDPHNTAFGLLHGAALVFIDGLGANPSAVLMSTAAEDLAKEKRKCILKLSELSSHDLASIYDQPFSMALDDVTLRLGGFSLPRKIDSVADVSFNLEAPTTGVNAMRVVRAMQLRKPILLEGSPGVGKTSLISALAAASGNPLTRINLSEQTDLMDLFGSDVPVEGGQSGEFAWRDAPFLQAMQRGHWVLLDEMNLASQSVLEGLNACLDHRGEAYISELDRTFKCHPEFCVFAAQNPHHQGGGRKGLPASFVNRFTVVYVDTLNLEDLQLIATRLYPNIPQDDVAKVITFVVLLDREVSQKRSFGSLGGPWEFNLRDTLRWLGLLSTTEGLLAFQDPSEFVDIVIKQRFRTVEDRARVDELFAQVFGFAPAKRHLYHQLSKDHFQIGHALLPRNSGAQPVPTQKTTLLKRNLRSLETIMTAIQQRTPVILVGPSGAGKSSIIKLLASVAGAELDEIALNSDIDTTDIVGGFEQVDISRSISALFAELQRFVGESTIQALRGGFVPGNAVLALFDAGASEATYGVERLHRLHTALTAIAAESGSELFTRFIKQCEILISQAHQASTARFEWVDGMLIYAIEQGKWLVLDNANLCSPSVLDRLNSLLELNGYLVVNEHSDTNGEPKIVRPHANFRLFLTMDPRHGELSRAMRNRGMEVYMDAGVMEPMPPAAQEDDVRRVEEAQWMADATTTEACMAVYSDIDRLAATPTTDIGSSDTSDVYDELLQVVFDHLPRDQMSILKRWKTHIIAASQMDADRLAPIVDVVSSVEDLSAHPRLAALRVEFLRTMAGELGLGQRFGDAQPLNPIRNTSLLSTGSRKNNSSAIIALSAIHDLAREILHIKLTEADILQRSTTTRMKEMTFLEKSASKSKASSSISAQSASSRVVGLPLFAFLTAVRRSLEAWLTEVQIETDTNTLARITELLALWRDMVALSNTHNLNESIFHVYLSLLESWVHTSSPTLPPAVLTATERALGGFRAPLRLTTGFAMEALWGALRPSVPASVGAWEAYNRLRGIADRFDAVVGKLQCSFETVAGLKSSLMEALTAVLTSEVEVGELVEGLEGAIVGLEERAGRSGVAARESLLRMVFDYLLKFKALGEDKSFNDTLTLGHFAGRTTASLLGYQGPETTLRTAYKQVLEDIYEYDFTSTGPQGLLQGRFALEMLRTGQAARNSFIGQLSKLNIELGALSKQFTQLTQQVTSDQLLQLNMLLLSNTKKIFELHSGSYSHDNYTALISALENLELALNGGSNSPQGLDLSTATLDVAFKSVVDEHLAHALNCLAAILQATSYSQALELSGKAWTHYALGCLKLYVPNVAFDPAMKRLVQRERYLKRKTELHNKIAAEKIFELRFTGQQDNAQIQVLEKRLANLGEEPPNSLVVRPAESEMTQLQGDMINLLQVVVSTSPHERLLSSILERRANYRDEEALFQKNLSQIIERLRRGYPLYKDLVDPILGFLYSLKMGLSLSAMEAEESSLAISLIEPSVPEVFNQEVIDGREDIKLLRLWQIAVHQNIEGYENTKQMSNKTAHSILQDFFEAWKIKTQKEQEEAAANASLYRYTGEEENADETELAAMFPAYEEEEKEKEKEKPAGSQHRELACQIALCHSAIHLTTEPEPTALSSLIRRGVSSLVKSIGEESSFCISPAKTEAFLPAIILSLKETSQWINGVTSQTYDFYTEENLEQARKLVVIVEKAHARLSVLAEAWPEHVTIQDAMEVCQELLDLPNSTPIAQSLVKVEKLHEHLNEWQGVASTEFSAAEHFDAVTQLIISWRRIELSAWPRLFNIEDEKCREEANSWWFYVYESAIANPLRLLTEGQNLKEHVEQLLTTLVAFIETSSIAQFPHRLQLLKAFEQHALRLSDEFPAMNLVEKGLHNLIAYFSQYASEAKEATAKSRKKYQKSMSDVVLLASWKDTNILALRDSAKRSHKKLFRVVKGYRQAINQPMAPLILAGMPEGSAENSATNRALPEPTNGLSIDFELIKGIYEKFVKNWTERPARLQDLPAAVQMMKRVARIPEDRAETINFIEDFSSSIISTIKQLQSETPGTLNDETKEIAKHLKTRKRKAFADALKELKNMGLKSNLSAALLGKQATLERILALADPLENSQTGIQGHSENHYFLRIAEILPKIRKAVVEHSPDLTSPEVARSVGFIENLLSLSLDQRSSISSSLKELEQAQSSMARYNTLSNLNIDNTNLYGSKDLQPYADLQRRFQWIPKVLGLSAELLAIHSEFSGKAFETANEVISSALKSANRVNDRFSAQKETLIHTGIWEDSAKVLLKEAQSTLSLIEGSMKTIRNDYPEIAYTTTQVLPWVSLAVSEIQSQINDIVSEPTTLQALDASLKTLSDSIFVALQQLKDAQATYPPSTQEPGWLLQHQSASSASLKALHTSAITRRIDDVIALTSRLQQSDLSNSQAVRALFVAYQPIIQEYTEISCRTVQEALSQYRSICKTTYILSTSASTLISKGFCMPQEKGDPEGGNTDNVEGGTGLGEGEGQDDISKDIKADEDLSELAQEKDKEKKDEEIEDEKDAVDIEDEMEGEIGDMADKEDDEKGSGDEKEDDDMDEETGDVDDLDPDAIDEKLWDGEADDDARDKEGDGMKDQQKQGEDMEAKKESGKEKQGEEMESKEDEDGEESEGEGADQEDDVRQQDDNEKTDAHVPEVDTLDLPEDMELDGDEKSGGEEEEDDMKMDDLSDVDDEGEEVKQDDKGDKQNSFPDLDDPEKQGEEGEPETENQEEGQENEGEENGEGEKNDEEPEEENKEEGADEPEPDSLLTTRDEQDAKEGEDTAPSDLQGVEGGNDEQDANEQSSAQRESGEDAKSGETNGKGADEAQTQEETTGQASAQESERPDEKSNKKDEQTEAESSFRKVGDMLEKWHQQRRQILNAKEEDEERPQVENMEIDDPEFEHLPNDDTKADTQALGAATEEQAHSLDESMAIDSGAQEAQEAFEDMESEAAEDPDAKDGEDNEVLPEAQQPASDDQETQAGAMIGETREQRAQRQQKTEETMNLDEAEETPETAPVIDINQESALTEFGSTRSREEARQLWQQYEQSTKDLSMGLCEQLRLILEPTLATKMRGDFRTGKRLNMKRIIPYIASQYKKDKIWMRRTKPSKRQYQVMIAVDDSKSMAESESVALAFETVALVAKALSQLEVGQISIVSFGESTRLIHPFDQPFTSEAGVKVFERFQFDQLKTNVRTLLDTSMGIFETAKVNSSADLWQLEIIISDGVCEDHEALKRLVRRAQEEKIMIVFVILDSVRDKSILHMKQVRFETGADGTQELKMERYLDTFPFGFYLVVNDIRELPGVLALALRQWFAEVADAGM